MPIDLNKYDTESKLRVARERIKTIENNYNPPTIAKIEARALAELYESAIADLERDCDELEARLPKIVKGAEYE